MFCRFVGHPNQLAKQIGGTKKRRRFRRDDRVRGTVGGLVHSDSSSSMMAGLSSSMFLGNNGGGSIGGSSGGGATDYDDQADIVRFLEDGSFIGQYGRWPKQPRKTSVAINLGAAPGPRPSVDGGEDVSGKDRPMISVSTTALSTLV